MTHSEALEMPSLEAPDTLRLVHLRRELKTTIELALAGMAPNDVTDPLATAAGLLDALSEFPPDAAPVVATLPRTLALSERALSAFRDWEERRGKGLA
jgi:hypothetical protein